MAEVPLVLEVKVLENVEEDMNSFLYSMVGLLGGMVVCLGSIGAWSIFLWFTSLLIFIQLNAVV